MNIVKTKSPSSILLFPFFLVTARVQVNPSGLSEEKIAIVFGISVLQMGSNVLDSPLWHLYSFYVDRQPHWVPWDQGLVGGASIQHFTAKFKAQRCPSRFSSSEFFLLWIQFSSKVVCRSFYVFIERGRL